LEDSGGRATNEPRSVHFTIAGRERQLVDLYVPAAPAQRSIGADVRAEEGRMWGLGRDEKPDVSTETQKNGVRQDMEQTTNDWDEGELVPSLQQQEELLPTALLDHCNFASLPRLVQTLARGKKLPPPTTLTFMCTGDALNNGGRQRQYKSMTMSQINLDVSAPNSIPHLNTYI
jgi:hypothetical protein